MHTSRHLPVSRFVPVVATLALMGAVLAACGSNNDAELVLSPAGEAGRDVVRSNGCAACHGRNGQGSPGPSFVGLYGSTVSFRDDTTAVADDDYLYEAITDPAARVRDGYGFPMPQNDLDDAEVEQVIAFIRDLAAPETTP